MIDFDCIKHDVQKWPCSRVYQVQMSLLKETPLFDIEISSICNLECKFCPRSKIIRNNKFMEPSFFDKLCKWLPDDAVVMFSGLGECLLNKNLSKYISQLKKRNISSCLVTNGILLTPEKQRDLIQSGIDQIQISYLTVDESKYTELVGNNGDFESLNHNLQHLSEIKPSDFRVQLNYLDLSLNCSDISAVKDAAIKWGFDFFYRRKHSRGGSLFKPYSGFGIPDSCFRCGTFASVHFITSDGDNALCCNDTEPINILGNVASSNYTELLSHKSMIILNKNEFDLCKRCTDDYRWYTLWNGNYDKKPRLSE